MQRPQYVDSQSGQVFDTSNANFEGWLTKQSVWLKDWRRRLASFLVVHVSPLLQIFYFERIKTLLCQK
jgi:hypothetical protein